MKFNLKAVVLLFSFIAAATITKAQIVGKTGSSFQDDAGNVLMFSAYTNLTGNPYFNKDWVKGDVKFKDGSVRKDVLVKYDELKDNLYTQAKGDKTGEFDTPVAEFTIATDEGGLTRFAAFPGNGKYSDNAFLQVLSDGNVKLIRKNAKAISEHKEGIGTAVVTREVVDNIDYYLLISGKLVKIKKDKKSVLAALGNKQPELEAYIKANNLNLKNDADLAKLITQYNTL
jgi:hypothetical protein